MPRRGKPAPVVEALDQVYPLEFSVAYFESENGGPWILNAGTDRELTPAVFNPDDIPTDPDDDFPPDPFAPFDDDDDE